MNVGSLVFYKSSMPEKNLVFKLWSKMLAANNHPYFINGLTSDFDFLNVDIHERKKQSLLIGF